MSESCYFFIEENSEFISCVCKKCKNEHYPGIAMWYWDGGFGPHEYICCKCGKNLKGEDDSKNSV